MIGTTYTVKYVGGPLNGMIEELPDNPPLFASFQQIKDITSHTDPVEFIDYVNHIYRFYDDGDNKGTYRYQPNQRSL